MRIEVEDSLQNYECPLCYNIVKNLEHSCQKKILGHNICFECDQRLKKNYGLKNDGCIYCGDRSNRKNIIEIALTINQRPDIRQINIDTNDEENHFKGFKRGIRDMFLFVILCIIFNMIYCFSRFLHHKITNKDHQHGINFSLENILFGMIMMTCFSFIPFCFCVLFINSRNNSVGIY